MYPGGAMPGFSINLTDLTIAIQGATNCARLGLVVLVFNDYQKPIKAIL
jgi:hypothetical protein